MNSKHQMCLVCILALSVCSCASLHGLPPGYVQGDVVSYSYVPNKTWTIEEGIGKLPYLCEYALMKHEDSRNIEQFHEENIRRIDMASKWSTVIMLYPRHPEYCDEIINLMIRCFHNRELIILSDYGDPEDEENYAKVIAILEKLWANRDRKLVSPEGDKATGWQLINNILAIAIGDEGLKAHGTEGLEKIHADFRIRVKNRILDGQTPFTHIKAWYNMIHYGLNIYAANQKDLDDHDCLKIPANCDFIGVDTYHLWWIPQAAYDPMDPLISSERIRADSDHWQDIITRYYPQGLKTECKGEWSPESQNDTHALMSAIDFAGAKDAMMFFIANSTGIKGRYATPVETMDAYYDSLRDGPWVGLSWWVFDSWNDFTSTLDYLDKTLVHYTPENEDGAPFPEDQLEAIRKKFIASRMRMFEDVVYNQFGELNPR